MSFPPPIPVPLDVINPTILQDAGYNYVNLDDCYSEQKRSSSGDIVASMSNPCPRARSFKHSNTTIDKQRFPSGMKKLTDNLHKMGL